MQGIAIYYSKSLVTKGLSYSRQGNPKGIDMVLCCQTMHYYYLWDGNMGAFTESAN